MVPTTWLAILSFFFFVAPGVLYDLESARRRVGVRESTFREFGRVALASTALSSLSLLVVEAVGQWWAPGVFPPPTELVRGGQQYLVGHLGAVARTAFLVLGIALLLALVASRAIHHGTPGRISYTSMWHAAFRTECPPGGEPHVRVELSDGTVWFGRVKSFSPDHEAADRDLMLWPPIAVKRPLSGSDTGDQPDPVELGKVWQRVVLKGTEIQSMAIKYKESSLSPPALGLWNRLVRAALTWWTPRRLTLGAVVSVICCVSFSVALAATGWNGWLAFEMIGLIGLLAVWALAMRSP